MKKYFALATMSLCLTLAGIVHAADADTSCEAKAAEKKLAGAAKSSFVKKCKADAGTASGATNNPTCEKSAADKKLHGAAKNAHIKKCQADAGVATTPAPAASTEAPKK